MQSPWNLEKEAVATAAGVKAMVAPLVVQEESKVPAVMVDSMVAEEMAADKVIVQTEKTVEACTAEVTSVVVTAEVE